MKKVRLDLWAAARVWSFNLALIQEDSVCESREGTHVKLIWSDTYYSEAFRHSDASVQTAVQLVDSIWSCTSYSADFRERPVSRMDIYLIELKHSFKYVYMQRLYLDGWCRGHTHWWRCGSRAPRSQPESPVGGIYSGSRRTRSSLCT